MNIPNHSGIKQYVLDEIIHFAKKAQIQKVILFGSRARGDYWRASDIDLAVYGGDILAFEFDVKENTSTLLDFDIIDLGQNIDAKLRTSIETEGILIYEKI